MATKALKASPFLHIVPVDDGYSALYNSLNLEIVFLKQKLVESCFVGRRCIAEDAEAEKVLKVLLKMGLLVDGKSDGYELYREYQEALSEPAINILYLLLTDACNIRCRYCYFLAPMPHGHKFSFMTRETAIAALNMFVRCVKRSIVKKHREQHVILYGGEPTLNKPVLLDVLQYINILKRRGALPKTLLVTLNTNGILLDREILAQCRESSVTVSISLDGPKRIHDQMRVYPSGRGTFDEVLSSYNLATQMGVKIGICVTIDQHNISRMSEIVVWLTKRLGVKGLGFNILIENGSKCTSANRREYADDIAQKLVESFKVARRMGVYEDRMMRRVKNFIDKTPVLSDCGGCGLQVVVSPDGQLGVCQAFCGQKTFFVREVIETFEPEKHPYWKQWRYRSPISTEMCRQCIALGNCGGGCPYNSYLLAGSIDAIDGRFCAHAQAATRFLIQDLWNQQELVG